MYMCKKDLVKHLRDLADSIEKQDEVSCYDCKHKSNQ